MNLLQAAILGVVQGITEFFPISSSGHLVVFEHLLNLPVKEMFSFDIAVHFGSLIAIIIYFFDDFADIFKDLVSLVLTRNLTIKNLKNNLFTYLVIASLPALFFGLFLKSFFGSYFRSSFIVGIMMIVTACYFLFAEKFAQKKSKNTLLRSFYIGLAQAFAIIPGVSRSGATISTGIFLGLDRKKSAHFSFLLGSIVIWGATFLTILDTIETGLMISLSFMIVGFISSFVASLISIHYLIKIIVKRSLNVFSLYLFIVGFLLIFFT